MGLLWEWNTVLCIGQRVATQQTVFPSTLRPLYPSAAGPCRMTRGDVGGSDLWYSWSTLPASEAERKSPKGTVQLTQQSAHQPQGTALSGQGVTLDVCFQPVSCPHLLIFHSFISMGLTYLSETLTPTSATPTQISISHGLLFSVVSFPTLTFFGRFSTLHIFLCSHKILRLERTLEIPFNSFVKRTNVR